MNAYLIENNGVPANIYFELSLLYYRDIGNGILFLTLQHLTKAIGKGQLERTSAITFVVKSMPPLTPIFMLLYAGSCSIKYVVD